MKHPYSLQLFYSRRRRSHPTSGRDLAGTWYPSSGTELRSMLQGYLDKADPENVDGQIFAIISLTLAIFFRPGSRIRFKLAQTRKINTVIIIGFSHHEFYDGISVYSKQFPNAARGDGHRRNFSGKDNRSRPQISFWPSLFNGENSVEMQIPFIRWYLKMLR